MPAERERAAASDHCVPDGLLDAFGLVGALGGHESHRDKLLCDHSLFWMTPSNKESASEEGGQPSERKHADITVTNDSEFDSEATVLEPSAPQIVAETTFLARNMDRHLCKSPNSSRDDLSLSFDC